MNKAPKNQTEMNKDPAMSRGRFDISAMTPPHKVKTDADKGPAGRGKTKSPAASTLKRVWRFLVKPDFMSTRLFVATLIVAVILIAILFLPFYTFTDPYAEYLKSNLPK